MKHVLIFVSALSLAACSAAQSTNASEADATPKPQTVKFTPSGQTDTAIFAGGCFWCIESDFEKLPGVLDVVSGYTGGETINPTYKQVTYAETGHFEAVEVTFDPAHVSYNELLTYFWHHIDPTDPYGQFCDKGSSYRTAIFARPDQVDVATASKAEIEATKPFKAEIVTPVLTAQAFYLAEDYHQDYYKKNPAHYNRYRRGCGRDARVKALWHSAPKSANADKSYGSGK